MKKNFLSHIYFKSMRVFLRINAKNIKTVQPPVWTATLSDLCHLSILLTGKPSIYKGRAFFPSSDSSIGRHCMRMEKSPVLTNIGFQVKLDFRDNSESFTYRCRHCCILLIFYKSHCSHIKWSW